MLVADSGEEQHVGAFETVLAQDLSLPPLSNDSGKVAAGMQYDSQPWRLHV